MDAENQALNALIADSHSLAANTLDSFDRPQPDNGFADHTEAPITNQMLAKEPTTDDVHVNNTDGRLCGNHTQSGQDETDMRDVCLGSDIVDGVNDVNAFHGFIHDGLNGKIGCAKVQYINQNLLKYHFIHTGMSTRDSSEEHQTSNGSEGIYSQTHLHRYDFIENVSGYSYLRE